MRKIFWVTGFFLLVCLSVFFLHISTNTEEFSRYTITMTTDGKKLEELIPAYYNTQYQPLTKKQLDKIR